MRIKNGKQVARTTKFEGIEQGLAVVWSLAIFVLILVFKGAF